MDAAKRNPGSSGLSAHSKGVHGLGILISLFPSIPLQTHIRPSAINCLVNNSVDQQLTLTKKHLI